MPTPNQDSLIAAAAEWARSDPRIRALLLKGSLGRGEGDERSDLDLVVVTAPGRHAEVWSERRAIAEALGNCLGAFDEAPWQAPHTFIAFYDGPVKVDLFFQDGEPHADPWLRDGFAMLVDPDGLEPGLRERLVDAGRDPELAELDAHAWDWLWWLSLKLSRGTEPWLVYVELVKFAETILLAGHNALTPEPWRGASDVERRLGPEARAQLRAAVPAAPDPPELARALRAAVAGYQALRPRLASERGMPLAEELMRQVTPHLGVDPSA